MVWDNGGGVAKFDNINWTLYNSTNSGLPNNSVRSIAIDAREINGLELWWRSCEI